MSGTKNKEVRVRIAPSPTGFLHVGTARAALFNWLFARHYSEGKFILRIEDTDLERSEKRYEDDIISSLEWLGLKWDEFYKQSDRTKIYSKYINKLLDTGHAFWCYHTEEELENERNVQMKSGGVPAHWCEYKNQKDKGKKNEAKEGIIRLVVDGDSGRKIKFNDIVRGEIEFELRLLGDISIAKDIDIPLYHLAVVVDDYETEISHVIRGEDHIANTVKHILIQEALGFEQPQYAHLPLILGEDRSKLSKRHAATSLNTYRELGYLPDAMLNFLGFLGWTPRDSAKEIMTANEMIEQFGLEGVHKSGAVFDIKKLNWINSHYIKMENDQGLINLIAPFVEKYFGKQDVEFMIKMAKIFRERLEYLDQVKEFHFFFKEPKYDKELLRWKNSQDSEIKESLTRSKQIVEDSGVEDKQTLVSKLDGLYPGNRGLAYWPLRVALSGEKASPDPVDIAMILGKEKTLERVMGACDLLV